MADATATRSDFFRLPRLSQAIAGMLLLFAAVMVWDQSYWWMNREDYSFGFLVPIFVGWVLAERWPAIRAVLLGLGPSTPGGDSAFQEEDAPDRRLLHRLGDTVFLPALFCALALFAFGALLRAAQGAQNPASLAMSWSFAWLLLACAWFVSDRRPDGEAIPARDRWRLLGLLIFPAFIWLISAPLVSIIENNLSMFLLNQVTVVVFTTFEFLGFPLLREGNILVLPEGTVGVEDACSGIRSLTACLFAGSFMGAVFLDRFWKKALLVGCAMAFAFFMNILRSLFLTGWAYAYGSDAIAGTVHDVTGYAVLILTCIGLICLLPLFNLKLEFDEPEADSDDGGGPHPQSTARA